MTDDLLCDPVCRALVTINGPEAGKALLNALDKTQGESMLSVIKALGFVSYAPALDKLTVLSVSQDMSQKKVSLYAISQIGSPLSAELLHDAAFRSNFTYEPTEATSSYLHWLKALTLNGNNALTEKLCSRLIQTCSADNQVQTRSAALSILVQSKEEEAAVEVYSSVKSRNREYIITALNLSKGFSGEKYTKQWIKIAGKQSGQIKADIVTALGDRGDKTALSFLKETLRDSNESVRITAIKASAMLGREDAMPELLEAMKRCNEKEIGIIKTQLLIYMGKNLGSAINQSINFINAVDS
jgi:HEAT repeat protein